MIQTLEIPSSYNIINLVCGRKQPFNTAKAPYEFLSVDENGVEAPYDVTGYDFVLTVFRGNTFETSYDDSNFVKNGNQLSLDIPDIDLDSMVYNYEIKIVSGNSFIKGQLKVESNAEQ